jgi:rhodanese-related sulfurtransferase
MSQSGESLPLEIDVLAVRAMLIEGEDFLLLDCRERDEHELVRIAEATLLPMSEIQARAEELEPHRERRIVVHCHHGGRSLRVTQWLRSRGFLSVQNMSGGIDQWAVAIDNSLPRY